MMLLDWSSVGVTAFVPLLALCLAVVSPAILARKRIKDTWTPTGNAADAAVQVWLFLIAAQAAVWVFSLTYIVSVFPKIAIGMKLFSTWFPVLLFLIATQLRSRDAAFPPKKIGTWDVSLLPMFGMTGVAVASLALWMMYLVWVTRGSGAGTVLGYVELYNNVHRLFFIAAGILGLGTLATAAFRTAVISQEGAHPFPSEYVFLFGAIYSLFLLAAYIPVRVGLWQDANNLFHSIVHEPPAAGSLDTLKSWFENRDKVETSLSLNLMDLGALIGPAYSLIPIFAAALGRLAGGKIAEK